MHNTLASLQNIIPYYTSKLHTKNIDSPLLSVEILLMHTLSYSKKYELLINKERILSSDEFSHFLSLFERRYKGEPLAYIVGKKEFYSRDFFVSNETLIPRPETEELIETLLSKIPKKNEYKVLDIGTGSGCIGLTLAKEINCILYMLDISLPSLKIAEKNAESLEIKQYLNIQADCLFLPFKENSFDIIITNPPYISEEEYSTLSKEVKYEPYKALCAKKNGLEYVTKLFYHCYPLLKKGGFFSIEFGYSQKAIIEKESILYSFEEYLFYKDYAHRDRYCIAKK